MLSETLPSQIKFSLINRLLTKAVSEIIDLVYRYCGQKETVIFCDRIKTLVLNTHLRPDPFGKNDLIIPKTKEKLVTKLETNEVYENSSTGRLITEEEYNKVVDVWSKCTDSIANEMMKEISSAEKTYSDGRIETNSVFMMADLVQEALQLK